MAVGQSWLRGPTFNLRSRLDLLLRASGSLVDALFYKDGGWTMEGLVQDVSIAIGVVETRDGFLAQSLSAKSFRTGLMTAFALAALLLAVLGIAGVMAYSVSRRTCEMGVRLSLGAEPTDVRGLVLREGVRPIFIGVALGVTVALAFARVLTTLVFEVGVRDPGVYLAVASFLTVATLTACYVPANRASRIDPVLALLSE